MSNNQSSDLEYQNALLKEENTELKQRILALTREERDKGSLFEALFDKAPFGIAIFDDKRNLLRLNTAAEKILDITKLEAIGCACDEVMQCYKKNYSCPGFMSAREFRAQRTICERNNKVLLRSVVQSSEASAYLLIETFVDITVIDEANIAQTLALQAKKDFLSRMSHELRTPMHAIMGYASLLKGSEDMPEEAMLFAKHIKDSSDRLMELITNLLEMAEVDSENTRLERVSVDIPALLQDLDNKYRAAAERKKNKLVIGCDSSLHTIMTDPKRLNKIIANLLSNAIKFTDAGEINCYAVLSDDGELIVKVEDTGEGINTEEQQRIFDAFEQMDNSRTRAFEGAGLSLTLARCYAESMGGRISLKSEAGEGSVFTLRLPLN